MKRQRNMAQMKTNKQTNQTPERELNKMKTNNLLDIEFKTQIIRMFSELSEDLNSIKNPSQKQSIH